MADVTFTDLGGVQRDLLCGIAALEAAEQTPITGVDLKAHVEQGGYDEELSAARLYHNLDALTGHGLLEKHLGHPTGRTNSYSLTIRGRRVLAAYIEHVNGELGEGMQEAIV